MSDYLNVRRIPLNTLFSAEFDGFQGTIAHSKADGETIVEQDEDTHRIFITLEGQTRATIAEVDERPIVLQPDRPGVVTIVPAGIKRRVFLHDIDFLVMAITVSDEFLRICLGDAYKTSETPLPLVQNVRNNWLLRTAQAFREAGETKASTLHMQTLALAMVRHIARSNRRVNENGSMHPNALARVLQLMQDRLGEDLTLTELATEAGLGISAFSRAFSKSVGTSPYHYFATLRMQRAMELLVRSNHALAQIAGDIGYSDQAHFTAAFTRHTGCSPGHWRSEFGTVPRFLPISRKTTTGAAV